MSFRTAKSPLEIDKVGGLGRPQGECAQGSAAEAVASRGFWSLTGTGRVCRKRFERRLAGSADVAWLAWWVTGLAGGMAFHRWRARLPDWPG